MEGWHCEGIELGLCPPHWIDIMYTCSLFNEVPVVRVLSLALPEIFPDISSVVFTFLYVPVVTLTRPNSCR